MSRYYAGSAIELKGVLVNDWEARLGLKVNADTKIQVCRSFNLKKF